MSKPILETGRVLQIAFIVSDVEAAAAKYAKLFGIDTPPVSVSGAYEDAHTEYWGKPS